MKKTYRGVDEELGIDFIRSGQDYIAGVFAVQDGNGEGVVEKSSVKVDAGPCGGLVEGVVVLGVVEEVEKSDGFNSLLLVQDREDLSLGEHATLVQGHKVLDSFDILQNTFEIKTRIEIKLRWVSLLGLQMNQDRGLNWI